MLIKVTPHKIEIVKNPVNEKEINITECEFEFTEIPDNYVKEAYFTYNGTSYKVLIENNKCSIPYEVLENKGQVEIGVVAYLLENDEYVKRYNPSPVFINTWIGSLKEQYENTEPITPSDKEQIEQAITDLANEMPTKTSDLENDSGFIDKSVNNLDNYTKTNDLSNVALSGSYNDLSDKPTIPDVSNFITKDVNNLTYYTLATNTGSSIEMSINSSTYVVTLSLKNSAGTILNTQTIDLPLESVVVNGSYDSTNKKIILTLESGSTIEIPVGDLVAGLQSEITNENKLSSDLVDDTNNTNKFVTASEKTTWNNKSDFSGNYNDLSNKPDLSVYATITYVNNLVGDIETILTTLDIGGGVE